jgi:hypothetical protein
MKTLLGLALLLSASVYCSGQSSDPGESPLPPESVSVTCEDPCPWDFNNDNIINADSDLIQFLSSFSFYTDQGCNEGDFDEDMVIDIQDLRLFVPHLGTACQD